MSIDYKTWRREVWELTNHEKLTLAPIFELEAIEIKLRRMISEYEETKHTGDTIKLETHQKSQRLTHGS